MAASTISEPEWDEGISMPVANAENKQLEQELERTQKEISTLQNDLGDNEDRVHAMSRHLRNVHQELDHNLALIAAHVKDLETEQHMVAIAHREDGRLKQETLRLEKELIAIRDGRNLLENKIYVGNQQLEDLKSHMNWDQQALEAWLEESARRDEDAMTLQKYSRQDDYKIKNLSLVIERLTTDAQQKRKYLDTETTETLTAQIELDKTAEEFRSAHAQRQELIQQWEVTIEQMQRRDREMDRGALSLARVKGEVRQREQTVAEKQAFLDNELENNQEMEKKIASQERLAAKLRIEHQEHENSRTQLQDELDTLKYTVERTATDLESIKTSVSNLKKDIISKSNKLQDATSTREQLQNKLALASEGALSAEEQAEIAEEALMKEEEVIKNLDLELRRIREVSFKKKEALHEIQAKEKTIAAEIQAGRAASRNLASRLNKLDQQSVKQQEIIYNQDFTIQQLERRIARMQGEVNTDEKKELEARVEDLKRSLEDKHGVQLLLTTQLKRLQDDIRRQKRDMEKIAAEKDDLTNKIEELDLHNEISEKELAARIRKKQDSMVEDNILKLEIKRLDDMLNKHADSVFSLEKRNLQLKTAMKERKKEIEVHMEMTFSQVKAADEERQTVNAELHQRMAKIDKLRKRYEILMVSMAPPEGEEEKSQAYYVIKAAQDREELQRQGDELDAKMRKAEKEIRALQNTLRLMNSRNETYRKSFNRVTETSEEYELKAQLDEQLRAAMDKYKYKRRQIRELQEDLQTISSAMDTAYRDETAYMEMIQEKQMKIAQVNKEMEEQKVKLDRVLRQVSKATHELRSVKGAKEVILAERDMSVRNLREKNKNVLRQIDVILKKFPEMTPILEMRFHQAGLTLPYKGPPSQSSSKTGSIASSRSVTPRSSSSYMSVTSPKTVDLALGLGLQGPPQTGTERRGSRTPSSAGSRRSSARSQK